MSLCKNRLTLILIVVFSIPDIQNKLFKLLYIVNVFPWHVFQWIFKYPSSGLRIGIIIIKVNPIGLLRSR